MLQQKIERLAFDFASRLIAVLAAAPLQELVELTPAPRAVTSLKTTAPRQAAPRKTKNKAPLPSAKNVVPAEELTSAALAFFAERGPKGATAHQLGLHLTELGLAPTGDVVGTLATSGAIRDAGFRRAAGRNATAPVYVAG